MKSTTVFGDLDVVDAHVHFFSHRFFEVLLRLSATHQDASVSQAGELTGWTVPAPDAVQLAGQWDAELERNGVSHAMIIASVPGDEESVAVAVAAYPRRFTGAFILDPTRDDVEKRTQMAFDEMGLRVACLFPAMSHFSMAECEGARQVAAIASQRPGTAVFVHCGVLSVGARKKLGVPARFDMRQSNPLDLHKLATEFPETSFIIPHFGAGMFRETMMLCDLCPNVYLDTSSSNRWMRYNTTPTTLSAVFEAAIKVIGTGRLLFGTDSSFFPRGWVRDVFENQVTALRHCGATAEDARAVFGGNFSRLLGLNPDSR